MGLKRTETGDIRFVALGDSYTIGTSVDPPERFPDQLVGAVGRETGLRLVANLGVNGYTSADVIRDELPALADLAPDLVTLLIGVNDIVQGVPRSAYAANLERILGALREGVSADRVVGITIPDYTVTPAGADHGDPVQRRRAIIAANATMTELASARSIPVVDIFDISRQAATDRSLVAIDGLHPSGAQYARWVERMAPVVRRQLGY
jgi:lysophospholipase L1-like esterase